MGQDDSSVRIGDAERDRTITLLGEHMSAGRLEVTEFDDRCARAAAARFRSDLRPLFADLPEPHPFANPTRQPTRPQRSGSARLYGRVALGACAVALVALAIVIRQPMLLLLVIGIVWFAPRRG